MTPDEIAQVAEVIDTAIAQRMEQVYGELEAMKEQVREAVEQVRATAEVLHDNDVALMGYIQTQANDQQVSGFAGAVNDAWVRFLRGEMERLGWRVVVPK